ncbi:MAG: carboxypeptidase-like regulatory domain-containing protein, partial [Euryarchaeota archaeon]
DIHGLVLDSDGDSLTNVTIELIDPETDSSIKDTTTDANGRYILENVAVKQYELHISKQGHETVIVIFKPEPIGISPVTLLEGDGERTKDELSETEGWSMENAVALATIEGLITLGCALVGVHASFEIKRAKKYRRTQALCWVALFSRGLILFGPALILFGMILLMFNKENFEDQRALEAF